MTLWVIKHTFENGGTHFDGHTVRYTRTESIARFNRYRPHKRHQYAAMRRKGKVLAVKVNLIEAAVALSEVEK